MGRPSALSSGILVHGLAVCVVMLRNIGAWSSHMWGDAAEYWCMV